ncbi:hypothetical protein BDV98DRAFT_597320 [Pterulicium gracile]|uniref:Uncharacterized protein n=1 Tax=Pterulicium gracile TaxID=1884261 RepID=A0A5C3Q6L4_9AGAR|nr:hypothetical protein BDV98DRAFT_597320 [Pterula gracilis]
MDDMRRIEKDNADLNVDLDSNSEDDVGIEFSSAVTAQINDPRLRELHLQLDHAPVRSLLGHSPRVSQKPHLVNICGPRRSTEDLFLLEIPSPFFSSSSKPCLRHLILKRCYVSWSDLRGAGAFPTNLLTLHIKHPLLPIPSDILYNTSSPRWQDLVLEGACITELSSRPQTPISLTALRTYTISVEAPEFHHLYTSIIWPQALPTKLTLNFTTRSSLTRFLDVFQQSGLANTFTHVVIDNELKRITLQSPQLECKLQLPINWFEHLIPHVHFPSVESVSIETPFVFRIINPADDGVDPVALPTDVWVLFFANHPSIRTLRLDGNSLQEIFKALGRSSSNGDPIVLPSLTHLHLFYPYLGVDEPEMIRDLIDAIFAKQLAYPLFCRLMDSLGARYGSGQRLERLHIDTESFIGRQKVMGVVGRECVVWNHEPRTG